MKIDLTSMQLVLGAAMKALRLRSLVLAGCLAGPMVFNTASYGQGTIHWHWTFDQASYTVGPSDSILLKASIFVLPESPGPFTGRVSGTFQGSLFELYDFDCGFCRDSRLGNVNISPGESFQLTFGKLIPKSPITPGSYSLLRDQPLIRFEDLATHRISDSLLIINVIPEPSSLALGFCGVLLVCLRNPWRRE
jgi:hypothetical protein